jgi:hypothetical protein
MSDEKLLSISIPESLHEKVKFKTVKDKITMREAAKLAMTAYVEDKI